MVDYKFFSNALREVHYELRRKYEVFFTLKELNKFGHTLFVPPIVHENIPLFYVLFKKDFCYFLLSMGDGLNNELVTSSFFARKLLMFGLKGSQSVFIQTNSQFNELKNRYPFLSIKYFPSFKNKPCLNFSYNMENDVFKLVFVSTIKPEKGVLNLIEAVKDIKNVELDIYGPLENNFELAFFESIKNHSNIFYKGVLNPNKVSEVINKYQLFIFPTFWKTEGFSNVLLDAMIATVPIIASNWNYNSEIIIDGENGKLFKTKDSEDLKENIIFMMENNEKRIKFAYNNKEKAKKYYIENLVSDFIKEIS
jgi:glycosyltransferase involved in cell wall biosynthesis